MRAKWKAILGIAVGLGLAAGPSPVGARAPDDLARGIQAYEVGDLDRAEALLRASLRSEAAARDRARAWLYLGLAQALRRNLGAAMDSFRAALTEDPEVEPDRERVPPAIVGEFDAVRANLLGELRVEASEPGARVSVDGRERGLAPWGGRIPVGRRAVRVLSADGYRIYEDRAIVVRVRVPMRVSARLKPRTGHVKIAVEPAGAEVHAAGRLVATTPTPAVPFPAGRHQLTIRHPGYEDETREVVIEPERTLEITFRLRPEPARWYQRRRTWAWLSLAISGGATVAGLLSGKSARASEEAIRTGQRDGTLDLDRYDALRAGAEKDATAANVLFGIAGAAAVTSVILLLVGERAEAPPARSVQVLPAPGGAAIAVRF